MLGAPLASPRLGESVKLVSVIADWFGSHG
jgi:hypothetical protein